MKRIKITTTLIFIMSIFLGCVKDDNFSTPTVNCDDPLVVVTNTIAQVKEMYTFGAPTVIDTDVIIEGYVVSSDKSGNIYKTISIQDLPENPTSAIKIAIDETNLYTKYNIGRKIYVKLNGLAVGYSYGSIQIGKELNGELDRISTYEIDNHIVRSCEEAVIVPKKVTISNLNKDMLEMLIEIENVQFKTNLLGQTYANVDNTETVDRILESFTNNCMLANEVIVRNSGFSKFKNELLPEGNGSIVAVFSNYYNDYQLYLRDTDDVQLNEERCDYPSTLEPTISLLEVKNMYNGTMVEFGVNNNYIVEGYVVSNDEKGNFENKLILQDAVENPTAGIQILLDNEAIFEKFSEGARVLVNLNKLYMAENNDVLSIGYPDNNKVEEIFEEDIDDFIYNSGEVFSLIPTEIPVSEINGSQYQNTLVKVINVQLLESELGKAFTYFSGTENGVRTLETCNEALNLPVFTNGNATFANELFPKGHGSITGVLNSSLEIRTIEDIQFTEAYEVCPVIIPNIMITEVADPKNSVSSRFVELYNAGETAINLTGWKLNKYLNGSTSVSGSAVDLSSITIGVGEFVIIANSGYAALFNSVPEIETTYISGNGDDVYELQNNLGEVVDVYGVVGEDGNGTNWEYLDGSAVRNLNVNLASSIFKNEEWTVSSNATNNLINYPNTPKNAPEDYSPNLR